VITVPGDPDEAGGSGLIGSGGSSGSTLDGGRLVLLAVDESTATNLAAAATRSQLSLVLKDRSRASNTVVTAPKPLEVEAIPADP